MDEEQIRELKGKLAEKQTALDTCLKGTGKVCASLRLRTETDFTQPTCRGLLEEVVCQACKDAHCLCIALTK